MKSWIPGADDSDFSLQNLPYCRFSRDGEVHVGSAIGELLVDLTAAGVPFDRALLQRELSSEDSTWRQREQLFVAQASASFLVPFEVGDYTDFYSSLHHATRVGSMFRPDNPLLPNYKWVPIGYHGRASTVVVSGTPVVRPWGQLKGDGPEPPVFGPSKLLDYELEVGLWVGVGNRLGHPIPSSEAESHLFGIGLVNDWSARDLQKWEYQPLGPFLAKSFATTVSPFVVTREALEPYRIPAPPRPEGDPKPLEYLAAANHTYSVRLEVLLSSEQMRAAGIPPIRVSSSNLADLSWTPGQLLTHHASNGCWLRPGDLLATGTVSGPTLDSAGCLLERTWQERLQLPTGEERKFLADGDEVILTGWAEREGVGRIGLGECRGTVTAVA